MAAVALLALGLRQCSHRGGAAAAVAVRPAERADASLPRSALDAASPAANNPAVQAMPAEPGAGPRMRALMLAFDPSGVRLEQSVAVNGRVKAPPLSHAPDRLEFEVYDPDGRRIYEGSFDHPRHMHAERVGPGGELTRVEAPSMQDKLLLRMPAELAAARIQFFEVLAGAERRQLGSLDLF